MTERERQPANVDASEGEELDRWSAGDHDKGDVHEWGKAGEDPITKAELTWDEDAEDHVKGFDPMGNPNRKHCRAAEIYGSNTAPMETSVAERSKEKHDGRGDDGNGEGRNDHTDSGGGAWGRSIGRSGFTYKEDGGEVPDEGDLADLIVMPYEAMEEGTGLGADGRPWASWMIIMARRPKEPTKMIVAAAEEGGGLKIGVGVELNTLGGAVLAEKRSQQGSPTAAPKYGGVSTSSRNSPSLSRQMMVSWSQTLTKRL